MDDEDRDSSDDNSSSEPLLDIPLPDHPIPKLTREFTEASGDITGIPLPSSFPDRLKTKQSTMFFDEDSSDIPPLPPLPHDMVMNMMLSAREKSQDSRERHKDGKVMKRDKSLDDTDNSRDDDEDRARQTNTSLGPVTLHVNRKLVPRLTRASVFDLNDENAKEIGRKLLRLKRLRRLRKLDENAEHKIEAKERISMWKEELLGGSRLSVQENLAMSSTANLLLENTLEKPSADGAVNAMNLNLTADKQCPTDLTSTIPENQVSNEAVDETSLKSATEPTLTPLVFVKVRSKNDQMEFNWPTEMILSTKLSPKLCYSCNPLEFDFGVASTSIADDKSAKMETKEKRRKKKKSREYLSRRKSSERNDCKEIQKGVENDGDRLHSTNSRSGSGHRNKKQSSSSSHQYSSGQLKEQSGAKDVHKTKCSRGNSKKKQPSDAHPIVDGKNKCNDTNSKDHKRNVSVKRCGKTLEPNKGKTNDLEKSTSSKLEQNLKPDHGKKRKLSGGDIKQLNKKLNISDVTKSAEVPQKGVDGRISDFEDMECSGGPGKWDTSSGSELDMTSANLFLAAKTFKTGESGKQEQRDRRRRQSFTSSDRESHSSQDYSDSDVRSHRSHSRSRSYSSYSYNSSKRSYSYSSDSDYHRRHSHSSSSRSHSRRRHSYSYTDDSYHSKSRSRSRSKRSRSRSRSHGGRFRSYSSYSHSSRSYSRSRSRSRSHSYRRYSRSRSYYKDRRQSHSQRTARESHKQSKRNKYDPLPTLKSKSESNKSKKAEELVSSNVKLTISKSGQSNEGAYLDNSKVATISQPSTSEMTAAKCEEKNNLQNDLHVDDDLKISEIPRPEEKVVVSIPLPTLDSHKQADGSNSGGVCLEKTISASKVAPSFIGPTLPVNHPLAHIQDIPVPKNEQFQPIGPNDPLVFKTPLHPPPPPPSFLTEPGSKFVGRDPPLPPRPKSPPPLPNDWTAMEDIAGNEEPIPHMLDLGAFKPAMIIPPEQADQYRALQHQAQLHARQRMREEAGIADEEEEEEAGEEAQQQQLIDDGLIECAQNTYLAAQPVIHLPQPQLVTPTLGAAALPQVVLGNAGFFQVPMSMQMVSAGPSHGLVSLSPSMVPSMVFSQAGAPMVIAAHSAGAMNALIRAHEAQAQAEAAEEAEAQAKARAQASLLQGQAHEWVHIVQMPGSGQAVAVPAHALASSVPRAIAMSGLRSAGLQMHHGLIPVQSVNHPSLHQSALVQNFSLGLPMRVGLPSGVVGAPQFLASPAQPQGLPLLIDSSGSIFVPRLMRPGHL